jgi:hypothetical protein
MVFNSAGASLTVDNTLFVNNQTNGTRESFGGAIANAGSLSIDGATLTDNGAVGSRTAVAYVPGASGYRPGGSQGGAIGNLDGSTAAIKGSSFTGNQALGNGTGDAQGGAICNGDASVFPFTGSGISISLSECTFLNNTAKGGSNATNGGLGGAITDNPGVNLAISNCSFTGN